MNKVIDKIITSVHESDNTKVVWHNPETGQLKIFGNNGWEVAGGGKLPELPEIIESGWVLDKDTLGIAAKVVEEKPNTCSYMSNYGPDYEGWKFADIPTLSVGESYELVEVGTNNKVTVVVIGMVYGPYTGYKFEGNLDINKIYSYGTYKAGFTNTASAEGAVASGVGTTASGNNSHAEGYCTVASGKESHAEGGGDYVGAAGYQYSTASGNCAHAEGSATLASGDCAHAEGWNTTASGNHSHTEGECTIASSYNQHVQGKYNIDDSSGVYQFIIGNGIGLNNRSNALAVKWDGTIVLWRDRNTPLELTPYKLEKLLALVD